MTNGDAGSIGHVADAASVGARLGIALFANNAGSRTRR
jgi:hypothetical protein